MDRSMNTTPIIEAGNAQDTAQQNVPSMADAETMAINLTPMPNQSQSASTSFLDLPREVRDEIYHYVWLLDPEFKASKTTIASVPISLRYHDQYEVMWCQHVFHVEVEPIENAQRYPPWLWTSKQIFHEGIEQFFRRATGFLQFGARDTSHLRRSRFPPVPSITVWVGDLDPKRWDSVREFPHSFLAWNELENLLDLLQHYQENDGRCLQRLRIAGFIWHSQWAYETCYRRRQSSPRLAADFYKTIFKKLNLACLELEVWGGEGENRLLYEIVCKGAQVHLVIKEEVRLQQPHLRVPKKNLCEVYEDESYSEDE